MATGDQADFAARLRALLPARWFPDTAPGATTNTPVLDAVLAGIANMWAATYSLLAYVKLQTRIATATDVFLDMIGVDYFGLGGMTRRIGERDTAYRARILAGMLPPAGTRAALVAVLTRMTGDAPTVFEPRNTADTGGYGSRGMTVGSGLGYGVAGGYGSLSLPFQCFVTAQRSSTGGIASVGGYYTGAGWAGGGYGVGALEYATLDMASGAIDDADVYAAIAAVCPAGTIAWTAIVGQSRTASLDEFVLDYNILA